MWQQLQVHTSLTHSTWNILIYHCYTHCWAPWIELAFLHLCQQAFAKGFLVRCSIYSLPSQGTWSGTWGRLVESNGFLKSFCKTSRQAILLLNSTRWPSIPLWPQRYLRTGVHVPNYPWHLHLRWTEETKIGLHDVHTLTLHAVVLPSMQSFPSIPLVLPLSSLIIRGQFHHILKAFTLSALMEECRSGFVWSCRFLWSQSSVLAPALVPDLG